MIIRLFAHLKNNSGFSLMETVVATGLLGIIGYGALQLSDTQRVQNRLLKESSDIRKSKIEVFRLLSNKHNCKETFEGKKVPNNVSSIKDKDGNSIMDNGWYSENKKLRFHKMKLNAFDSETNILTVNIFFKAQDADGDYSGELISIIDLKVSVDGADKVEDCTTSQAEVTKVAAQTVCNDLGGTYDVDTELCDEVMVNTIESFKRSVCSEVSWMVWDDVNKICKRQDQGTSCATAGTYVKGYTADGSLICL